MYLVDKRTKESFQLHDGAVIGRDSASDFVIGDRTVSRAHAQIEMTPDGIVLRDLGSSHGTYCNQRPVGEIVLQPGMKIALGGAHFDVVQDIPFESFDPRVDPLSKLEFRPVREVWDPVELQNSYERLRAIYELNRALGVERELDPVINKILQTAFKLLSAERGAVQLFRTTGYPRLVASTRAGTVDNLSLSQTVVDEVVRDRKGIIVADAQLHDRFSRAASIAVDGVRAIMCVPLLFEDEILGVIQVDSQNASHAFGGRDLAIFSTIASQAAITIKERIQRQEIMVAQDEARSRLQRVIDQLPCAVYLLDESYSPRLSNPAAESMATTLGVVDGAPLVTLGGKSVKCLLEAKGSPVELLPLGQDGPRFVARAHVGEVETILVVEDITDLHAQQIREAQTERLAFVGQVAGGLSRDFQSLVDVVVLGVSHLRGEPLTPEMQTILQTMVEAAEGASRLLKELVPFCQAEDTLDVYPVVDAQIRSIVYQLQPVLPTELCIELELYADNWLSTLRPSYLEGVIRNLIDNASDATDGVGQIIIRTRQVQLPNPRGASSQLGLPPGDYVELQVQDNGPGIRPDIETRLFEPLFTTKGSGQGTGLGLSSVRGIVEMRGGLVSVSSKPGQGAIFTVLLPRAPESVTALLPTTTDLFMA
ncbi:MAG: FHA domain-containing protein [Myxococcales bacterium]|nr:FHA domain-containing protein [Myxococcales bacterium]